MAKSKIDRETADGRCTFYFVSADVIRDSIERTLPAFQALRSREGAIVERTLSEGEAYRSGYTSEFLGVSHRWEEGAQPDREGAQMAAVRTHLRKHREIRFVWYDFWCAATPRTGCDGGARRRLFSRLSAVRGRALAQVHAAGRAHARGQAALQAHACERQPALPRDARAHSDGHLVPLALLDPI